MKRKPSRRILNLEARTAINAQADEIASQARALGTSGQAVLIAQLPPLEAAHAAIRCFLVRLADDSGHALSFVDTLRDHACMQRVSEAVQP